MRFTPQTPQFARLLQILSISLGRSRHWVLGSGLPNLLNRFYAIAGTAVARLSHRNSVCPSVRPSVTRVD